MFVLEKRHEWIYAMYDFTLDELEWLIEYIPHEDEFAKDIRQAINEMKQSKFEGHKVA